MEQVHCNLCGSNQPIPFITTSDRFSGNMFTLSKCGNCGLIYLTPRPTAIELSEHYPDNYEAYHSNKSRDNRESKTPGSRFLKTLLNYVEKYHPKKGLLLDIGCATGDFLHTARNEGWQVMGIEVIDRAARIARMQYGLEIINTDVEDAIIEPSSMDVVTMWDVLEHLPYPRRAIEKIHKILKPDGMLFFSIPNLSSFDGNLFRSDWIGWDSPRHFTLFTQQTIQRLLNETGFSIKNQKCLTGGKGTFKLSLDRIVDREPRYRWIKQLYPVLDILLWPYRQVSYMSNKGPIMFYAAQKN